MSSGWQNISYIDYGSKTKCNLYTCIWCETSYPHGFNETQVVVWIVHTQDLMTQESFLEGFSAKTKANRAAEKEQLLLLHVLS